MVLLLQNEKCLKIKEVWNLKTFQGVFHATNICLAPTKHQKLHDMLETQPRIK